MPHDIVTIARTWINVPFMHQGRSRSGVDCLGLLIMVAQEIGVVGKDGVPMIQHDCLDYSKTPDGVRLYATLENILIPRPPSIVQTGDIVLCRIEGYIPQHVGIIGDYAHGGLSLIHAYAPARKVVEHPLDNSWRQRVMQAFAIP